MVIDSIHRVTEQYRSQRQLGQRLHDKILAGDVHLEDFPRYQSKQPPIRFDIDVERAEATKKWRDNRIDPLDVYADSLKEAMISTAALTNDKEAALEVLDDELSFTSLKPRNYRSENQRDWISQRLQDDIRDVRLRNPDKHEDLRDAHQYMTGSKYVNKGPDLQKAHAKVPMDLPVLKNTALLGDYLSKNPSTTPTVFSSRPTTDKGRGKRVTGGSSHAPRRNQSTPWNNYDFNQS